MREGFLRSGPLLDIGSYPAWAQDLVQDCADTKRKVVDHELFKRMRDAQLGKAETHAFLAGTWPVIEQFPQYMAMNLVKIQYGRTHGHDMARRYLIRNIRVEQSHADYWIEWSEASGFSKEDLIAANVPMADARAESLVLAYLPTRFTGSSHGRHQLRDRGRDR